MLYTGFAPLTEIHTQTKKSLINQTKALTEQITFALENTPSSLEDIIKDLHVKEDADIMIIDTAGNELVSFIEKGLKKTTGDHSQTIESALIQGWDIQKIYYRWELTPIVSVPLKKNNVFIGIVQSYYPRTRNLQGVLPRGATTLISVIILGGLISLLSRYLTRPVRELTKIAREMTKGRFGLKVPIRSHDEVGQLAETFNNMSQSLEDLHNSRRELFADISHEIRSPLARILSDAEILIDRKMDEDERNQHLQAICADVKNLDRLIADLSILSRLELNQVEMSFSRSKIADIISNAASLFILRTKENNINLKQTVGKNLPEVMIDARRIGQVMSNLLTNAIRYTPEGGTIEIGAKQRGQSIEVWVKDNGQGIPEEKLPHIFKRFYRTDKSRSRSTGGTGLGLAIARQFVRAHGGKISAESKLGEGARIFFTLPVSV
jgi:signal transduction histidine kinase